MDIEKLRSELLNDPLTRGYSAMSDSEAAADLNTEYRKKQIPIPVENVRRYLFTQNKWLSIKNGTQNSAKMATDAVSMFTVFDVRVPEVETTVINLLDSLIADGLIVTVDKDAILEMQWEYMSRAEELRILGGSPEVGAAHVQSARA